MPIVVGALVFGLIAIGVFFFMRKDPVLPPQPAEPVRTPVVVQPVQPTLVETSGPAFEGGQTGGSTSGGGGGGAASRRGPSIAGAGS
ncbi:MAG: hypothetical protein D6724_07395 [Armatimonadetes bacterium]|nr:MAG: hypothetical protein D6724_07395 [Armatimonadota bacterium]